MLLYHTGYQEIRDPDVHYGRKNADFGQGFYLTDDREFACRWAKERKGSDTIVNTYDLSLTGLKVHRFARPALEGRGPEAAAGRPGIPADRAEDGEGGGTADLD